VSLRLVTVIVLEYAKVWVAEAWATADPAGKETAAETPATRQAAPAMRGMKRPARIIRILMKAVSTARENIIDLLPSLLAQRICSLKQYAPLSTRQNRGDNFARHTWCNLRKPVKSNYFRAHGDAGGGVNRTIRR
jgi:hypothetical protein